MEPSNETGQIRTGAKVLRRADKLFHPAHVKVLVETMRIHMPTQAGDDSAKGQTPKRVLDHKCPDCLVTNIPHASL